MISRKFTARVSAGAIACAFFALAPEAQSAVRARLSGTHCDSYDTPAVSEVFRNEVALWLVERDFGDIAVCPVPMGTDLVELDDLTGRKLNFVSVIGRMHTAPEVVTSALWALDYNSDNVCICDQDIQNVSGALNTLLHLNGDADSTGCDTGCLGGAVPTEWTLSVAISLGNITPGDSQLAIHQLNVQDT
jgi:hypothetical protein